MPSDIDYAMPISQLASFLTKGKSGRAPGEDGVVREVYALDAFLFAMLYHFLFLRVGLRFEEPSTWRGGLLKDLSKRKGSPLEASSSRGTFLEDHIGKGWHLFLPAKLENYLPNIARRTQFGGRKKLSIGFAAQLSRMFPGMCKDRRRSGWALFLDVIGAFDTTMRTLISAGDLCEADVVTNV